MNTKSNATATLKCTLDEYNNGLWKRVVQKGNVTKNNCYALQKYGDTNYVYRAPLQHDVNFNKNQFLKLSGTASSHTQTFEYAGRSGKGEWFVGVKGKMTPSVDTKYYWASQIARATMGSYASNTDLPRFSCLNRAGTGKKYNNESKTWSTFTGNDLYRSEAAVSPNYSKFLLATIDTSGNGYFFLYDLDTINKALDNAGTTDVDIGSIPCPKSFMIEKLTSSNVIGSIQGYDIDNSDNIYISSQKNGDSNRNIYKIPWGTTQTNWDTIPLTNKFELDTTGYHTELESVQVIDENDLYLTVAYHRNSDNATTRNRIFEIQW